MTSENDNSKKLSTEEFNQRKTQLLAEIQQHKTETQLFRQQAKIFLRQGVKKLPEKQQEQWEAIQAKEQELSTALAKFESSKTHITD